MKAIAYQQSLPIDNAASLQDIELPEPQPGPRDLQVDVRAIAVNPVDTKVRARSQPAPGQWAVLGWDVVGTVRAVGPQVSLFKPGDRVWYAGAINRQGGNAQVHLVDERIAALAPKSLDDASAAAMPLTGITAWEMLFDRLRIPRRASLNTASSAPSIDGAGGVILIIGAAGGVGSIMVQLARQLTDLTVVATASRPETVEWVSSLGVHHVISHAEPLADSFKKAGLAAPQYVVSLTHSDQHFAQVADMVAPQGHYGLIDDPAPGGIDVTLLKRKAVSLHWESMFTRSLFETPDMVQQHHLLTGLAQLVDAGTVRSTVNAHYGVINAANLRRAHAHIESGKARGKIVLEGF